MIHNGVTTQQFKFMLLILIIIFHVLHSFDEISGVSNGSVVVKLESMMLIQILFNSLLKIEPTQVHFELTMI